MSYLPRETLCFWPLLKISGRNWAFRAEISKTRIDRHVVFTEGNLMFLTTSQYFWQKLNISSRNTKNENWSTCHIYRRKPYVFEHFPIFLAETAHFEQISQTRELIAMSYLPNETLCFWSLPNISRVAMAPAKDQSLGVCVPSFECYSLYACRRKENTSELETIVNAYTECTMWKRTRWSIH
jgi:hypothetical protein